MQGSLDTWVYLGSPRHADLPTHLSASLRTSSSRSFFLTRLVICAMFSLSTLSSWFCCWTSATFLSSSIFCFSLSSPGSNMKAGEGVSRLGSLLGLQQICQAHKNHEVGPPSGTSQGALLTARRSACILANSRKTAHRHCLLVSPSSPRHRVPLPYPRVTLADAACPCPCTCGILGHAGPLSAARFCSPNGVLGLWNLLCSWVCHVPQPPLTGGDAHTAQLPYPQVGHPEVGTRSYFALLWVAPNVHINPRQHVCCR